MASPGPDTYWGNGTSGELGNGATSQSLVPQTVKLLGAAVCL